MGRDAQQAVDVNIPILLIIFMLGHMLSQQWYIFNIFGNFFVSFFV